MDNKIGLKRGAVVLKQHHQEWARAFEVEKEFLQNLLGSFALEIEHIGSTAVQGLAAKPIIDILLAVKSLAYISDIRPLLERAGYEYRKNGSDGAQVLFVKGPEEQRTHYLHITEVGSSVWENDIVFRNYLRTHPKSIEEYTKLKENLASQYADKREQYTAGKKDFIKKIIDEVRRRN